MSDDRVCRDLERLRNPERLARLEIGRVVGLCLAGPQIRRVLDVGTGSGVFAEAFVSAGCAVTGVDIQQSMLEAARQFAPEARFLLAPSESLPFEDDAFELVFLGLVLHETENPAQTLKEAHRVASQRTGVLEWRHEEQPFGPPLEDRLKAEDILGMARSAGFRKSEEIRLDKLVLYLFDP